MLFILTRVWSSQLGVARSSTIITLGKPYPNEVAKVANELAWKFLPLGTCFIENIAKLDCNCLIWPRYHYVLWSLASNSPFTCPIISLKLEKTSIALSLSFYNQSCSESFIFHLVIRGWKGMPQRFLHSYLFRRYWNDSNLGPLLVSCPIHIEFLEWKIGCGNQWNFYTQSPFYLGYRLSHPLGEFCHQVG